MKISIERATPGDVEDVERLLEQHQLPVAGWRQHLSATLIARDHGTIIGCAALERFSDGVLLRSVAVAPGRQNQGLGHELSNAAIRLAEELRAPAIYLLTTTAERFFPRFGFEPIARDDVPATVRTSIEFTSACPASATVMRKRLQPLDQLPSERK